MKPTEPVAIAQNGVESLKNVSKYFAPLSIQHLDIQLLRMAQDALAGDGERVVIASRPNQAPVATVLLVSLAP